MLRKNPMLKYISKPKRAEVFHSSGYARVQSGENFGAVDQTSFEQRQKIERERGLVRKYGESRLMTGGMGSIRRAGSQGQAGGEGQKQEARRGFGGGRDGGAGRIDRGFGGRGPTERGAGGRGRFGR